ncbi:MAG: sigma-70 region 4 domain-containing protein [Candidatus Sumerlaeaceae bacterium]|nr:sigma-70 region 4 domain-containing protein [Candidatus Sumerlaeaceae bacterium]
MGRLNFSEITGPAVTSKSLLERMEVLEPRTRDIVMLCHVQAMDEDLVGRTMGISTKAVRKELGQAREILGMTAEEIAEAAAREFGPPPNARDKTRRTVRSVGQLAPATRRRIQQAADTAPPVVAMVLADSPWQRFVQQVSHTFLCFYRRHAMALAMVLMVAFGAWAWKADDSHPVGAFAVPGAFQTTPWLTDYTAPVTGSAVPGISSGFRQMVSGLSTLTDYSPITEHRTNTDGESVVVREQRFFHRATLSYGVATEVEGPNGEASKVTVIIPGK